MSDFEGHIYSSPEGVGLAVQVFRPPAAVNLRTAIILIHGGGWRMGEPAMMHPQARALAKLGFTAIALQYRLLNETVSWPAPLADVESGISWVAANAEMLGIDAGRIVLQGSSAGAHLALLAGARRSDLAAIVAFFAPAGFSATDHEWRTPLRLLLGEGARDADGAGLSPIELVTADFPPTFLLHGASDLLVRPEASIELFRALNQAGVKTELHILADQLHGFIITPSLIGPIEAEVAEFLRRTVLDSEAFLEESRTHNPFARQATAAA